MTSTTTVIIVNYRTADLAVNCLRSIEAERARLHRLHVVIVDNASGDGSAERLRAAIDDDGWGPWTTLIESPRNGGFAAGNNIGIRARPSDFYILLNPDTIVTPGAIVALVEFMEAHPRVGIAGSRLEDRDGGVHATARRCPSPLGELEAAARTGALTRLLGRRPAGLVSSFLDEDGRPMRCDWVSGAAMCVRREVFDEIGLLDEGYFLYFEELDLCERARHAQGKWEVWSVPQSRVVHVEGASTGILDPRRQRPAYWYDSRRRYFLKRHGVAGLICADLFWGLGRTLFAMRQMIGLAGRTMHAPRAAALDLLWGDAKSLLRGEAFRIARGS